MIPSVTSGGVGQTVLDGSLLLAVPIAAAAGLVSFLSPCVLPLVPGYLGYVTGLSGVDLEQQRRGRLLAGAALFVAGFTAVYVALGWAAGAVGYALQEHSQALARGARRADRRPRAGVPGRRPAARRGAPARPAPQLPGWPAPPCSAPLSGSAGPPAPARRSPPSRPSRASAGTPPAAPSSPPPTASGLGVPFLLVALAYRRALGAIDAVRRRRVLVTRIGGALLVTVGVLLASGAWFALMARLQGVRDRVRAGDLT